MSCWWTLVQVRDFYVSSKVASCLGWFVLSGGGQGGGSLGEKGAGGVWEMGVVGTGSGIPKVVESGRNGGQSCNIVQYFATEKAQRSISQQK